MKPKEDNHQRFSNYKKGILWKTFGSSGKKLIGGIL